MCVRNYQVEVVEKIESQPPPAPADEPSVSNATPLEVTDVNFNIESEHYTHLYDTPMLVVCWGQKFTVTLTNRTALPKGAVLVARAEWIITVGHRTFAEQNQLMTEQKHRCSDIVADRSIDAARGTVLASWLTAGLWLPY